MDSKNINDDSPIRLANTKMVRSWSSVYSIVDGIDKLADRIKEDTGSHCDRSKLLNALSEIILDNQHLIDTSHIRSPETLKEALAKALKKQK